MMTMIAMLSKVSSCSCTGVIRLGVGLIFITARKTSVMYYKATQNKDGLSTNWQLVIVIRLWDFTFKLPVTESCLRISRRLRNRSSIPGLKPRISLMSFRNRLSINSRQVRWPTTLFINFMNILQLPWDKFRIKAYDIHLPYLKASRTCWKWWILLRRWR